MKNILLLLLALTVNKVFGQSVEREIIGSMGGFHTVGVNLFSHTVGNLIASTNTNTGFSMFQGYQQTSTGTSAVSNISKTALKIWPNPATNILQIKWEENQTNTFYEITDATGKVVLKGTVQDSRISIENIASGNYFLRLQFNGEEVRSKFIKI